MNKNVLKTLIPLIAIVVIAESVVLIQNMDKKKEVETEKGSMEALITDNPTVEVTPDANQPESMVSLVFGTDSKTIRKGESQTVTLNMVPKQDYNLDAVELFVTYDPEAFEISGLDYNRSITRPQTNKVSTKQPGLIVTSILDSTPKGMKVTGGESLELISFKITAKKVGKFLFGVNTGKSGDEAVTMLVDNETSNAVPFSSNKLEINVAN